MMLYLRWILSVIIGSILIGIVKSVLEIEVTSSVQYGALIYDTVSSTVSIIIFYFLFSAILGHRAK